MTATDTVPKAPQILAEARARISQMRQQKENPDRETIRVPPFAVPEILRIIASRTKTSVLHIFPLVDENIRPRTFELSIWRQVAKRGVKVERIYVVPHAGFARAAVQAAVIEDKQCGIVVEVVNLTAIPGERALSSVNQYVVSDNSLVLRSEDRTARVGDQFDQDWTLSEKEHEVSTAKDLWDALNDAVSSGDRRPAVDLEEPLVLSADLIGGVANVLCSGDHIDRSDCSWYHGAWQYMRLLDLVSTPTWHDAFYRSAFESVLADKPKARVLVSGTADYSLLAYLFSAAKRVGADPEIVVLDQCATPLFACRWFAKHYGFSVRTAQIDVLEAPRILGSEFDLVTSDAFLTRFGRDLVERVVDAWAQLLSLHSGTAITTVRLHGSAVVVRDEDQAVADFVSRAKSRLPRWQQFIRSPSQTLLTAIERYARQMVSNPLGDEQDILTVLRNSGFEIKQTEVGDVPGELYPTVYLRLVAQRTFGGRP